ncbi:hypothetical protein JCM18918_3880 [Cutibacterium acnes JCM 18918]|nr:hypothetical protein JCM18918_3880 [Cutibacterium acnes JCM 18918]
MLWTSGVSLSAHLRWLNISDRRRSLRTLRNVNRRLCNQAFFTKITSTKTTNSASRTTDLRNAP